MHRRRPLVRAQPPGNLLPVGLQRSRSAHILMRHLLCSGMEKRMRHNRGMRIRGVTHVLQPSEFCLHPPVVPAVVALSACWGENNTHEHRAHPPPPSSKDVKMM